ncbi:hypothetical protein HZA96_01335 [Candidatus Woesearchaeota archaeon]|nr:hypothetical protein [Candidatus Woesearchaeota archaeon]
MKLKIAVGSILILFILIVGIVITIGVLQPILNEEINLNQNNLPTQLPATEMITDATQKNNLIKDNNVIKEQIIQEQKAVAIPKIEIKNTTVKTTVQEVSKPVVISNPVTVKSKKKVTRAS